MSNASDCCTGKSITTPTLVSNCPGLSAIAYRAGTHSRFKETMLARLSSGKFKTLHNLGTRQDDDFSIALIDAWAMVADILTFYNERIASEAFLRTSVERQSVIGIGELTGYALNPGVSADTFLVFDLADTQGSPPIVGIDSGTKVQSVPEPGEQPQIFETQDAITARPAWNAIKPRQTKRPNPGGNAPITLRFSSNQTNIRAGDGIYYKNGAKDQFGVVSSVQMIRRSPVDEITEVRIQTLAGTQHASDTATEPNSGIPLGVIGQRYATSTSVSEEKIQTDAAVQRFDLDNLIANLNAFRSQPVYAMVFRQRAAIFGHNAPAWDKLPAALRIAETYYAQVEKTLVPQTSKGIYADQADRWNDKTLEKYGAGYNGTPQTHIVADSTYPMMAFNSYIVLRDKVDWALLQVTGHQEVTRSEFTLTNKVSQISPHTTSSLSAFSIQHTTIFGHSDWLPLERDPVSGDVSGDTIALEGWYTGLRAGQTVFFKGESRSERGVIRSEFATIKEILHDFTQDGGTQIRLHQGLAHAYIRSTVTINANVAPATHGETVQEVLGSGDGSQPFQKFVLRQPPLTHVGADTPTGLLSTLRVFVNDIEWREAPTLYGRKPGERIFVTRLGDDGKTTIQFGNGITGARLPTGQENIRAIYRRGLGLGGLLKADQLSMLLTRPPGVHGATNPHATEGGDDPENLNMIRQNAPIQVMTLDRIVSLLDYQDFARAFAGIAKAHAVWTGFGNQRGIFITVAAPGGGAITATSKTYKGLLAAIRRSGDPHVPVYVKSYARKTFRLKAHVKIHPDHSTERVLENIRATVINHFSFEQRTFGQDVTPEEVYATIQGVSGVIAVAVNEPQNTIAADLPQAAMAVLDPAVILTLDPATLTLEIMP
jgi:hypothetical protein